MLLTFLKTYNMRIPTSLLHPIKQIFTNLYIMDHASARNGFLFYFDDSDNNFNRDA